MRPRHRSDISEMVGLYVFISLGLIGGYLLYKEQQEFDLHAFSVEQQAREERRTQLFVQIGGRLNDLDIAQNQSEIVDCAAEAEFQEHHNLKTPDSALKWAVQCVTHTQQDINPYE